jgi:predicted DNA-binding transcriptional regulator YafY
MLSDAITAKCKVEFNYNYFYIPEGASKPKTRYGRKDQKYVVSPYHLLINEGNYYLLCFDDKYQNLRVYRVDRMQNLSLTGIPRVGEDQFRSIDVANYTKRVFSMYGGTPEHVTIRFINTLLDTVIDRFGIRGAIYSKIDDKHFTVTVPVEVSDQFFGWLCGFGKRVKILSPETVVDRFEKHLAGMHELYE